MEIADLFIVNKADRDGAEQVVADLRGMLALASGDDGGLETIFETSALSGAGVEELIDALEVRAERSRCSSERADARARQEVMTLIEGELARRARALLGADRRLDAAVERVRKGESDPYSAAEAMLAIFDGAGSSAGLR
jgi:LAO/AO transport system kinase